MELQAERRQLTVMFVDLVGSTALSERLDPEELREVILAYQAVSAEAIRRYDGHIAQYLGDGLLVYFGHPQAHEDDAQRAVHAGLGIVDAMRLLGARLLKHTRAELSVRVGIHTGLVVVGEVGALGRHEHLALGSTPNLAARLQGLAEPGTVVVSEPTRLLTRGSFECVDLGMPPLKGIAEPLRVWRVTGNGPAVSRFDAATRERLTPLVGREQEIGLLLDRWRLAQDGEGQVVLVCGEEGVGKSRILSGLVERLHDAAVTPLQFQCSPYFSNSAFYPIAEWLQRLLGFHLEEPVASKLDKIEALVVGQCRRPVKDVRLIASILGVAAEERRGALPMAPKRQREEAMRALLDLIEALGGGRPALMLFEDVHWADASSLELCDRLIGKVVRSPLLVIITHRPEFAPPFAYPHLTRIVLPRLARAQSAELVSRLTAGRPLSAWLLGEIVSRTDGVPLFVEELTKAVLESSWLRHSAEVDASSAAALCALIPATLRDSLMARLDRLPSGKPIAEIAATIGREFTEDMLRAVAAMPAKEVARALLALVDTGLVVGRNTPAGKVYSFKHALVQEVASESLLKSQRRDLHAKIAGLMEERFVETVRVHPELVAQHYTEAALIDKAVPYWVQAAQRAVARSANIEAAHHIGRGLALLEQLSDAPERQRSELELRIAQGTVLIATKGYAALEVEHTFARAQELCESVGSAPQHFAVIRGQCQIALLRAHYQAAQGHAKRLLALASEQDSSAYRLDAHMLFGLIRLFEGRFQRANAHLKRCVRVFDPEVHREHGVRHGLDIGSACLAYHARTLWFLGYPDQALERASEAVTVAQTPSISLGLAQALGMLALVHQARRDLDRELVDRAIHHSVEQGIAYWAALTRIASGWQFVQQGRAQEGLQQIEEGMAAYLSTGAILGISAFLVWQAEACQQVGRYEAGLQLVDKGLRHIEATGERYYAAEVHRRRGELLLAAGGPHAATEAEACFQHALVIAREQGALSWALRAATSLARLWIRRSWHQQARGLLAGVRARFTEGFDTADLRAAADLQREAASGTRQAPGMLDEQEQLI